MSTFLFDFKYQEHKMSSYGICSIAHVFKLPVCCISNSTVIKFSMSKVKSNQILISIYKIHLHSTLWHTDQEQI